MAETNPYKLKISQLRALAAIAEVGSFSDAAMHLDVSQSSVSHAIATLEEELGVVLLSRGRQGAVLTPVGEQITVEARQVLKSLESIRQKAQLAKGLQGGRVRVAGFRSVATHILPMVIEQFHKKHSAISVTIDEFHHYHQVEEALRQGRADLGFTYLPTAKEFESFELLRDRYIVLLPPTAKPISSPISWEQLMAYSLILPPPQDCCREMIERHLSRFNAPPQPAYEVKEDSTMIGMVQRGLGASIMAKLAAEPIPENLLVLDLPVPLERIIGVIILSEALHPPAIFAFIETLKTAWRTSEWRQLETRL